LQSDKNVKPGILHNSLLISPDSRDIESRLGIAHDKSSNNNSLDIEIQQNNADFTAKKAADIRRTETGHGGSNGM
jgi:hypothetical protein